MSATLYKVKMRYHAIKKVTLALVVLARKLRPYFQGHTIVVLTNQALRSILERLKMSRRLKKWTIELRERDIQYRPRPTIKRQVAVDFIIELSYTSIRIKNLKKAILPTWTLYVDDSSNRQK